MIYRNTALKPTFLLITVALMLSCESSSDDSATSDGGTGYASISSQATGDASTSIQITGFQVFVEGASLVGGANGIYFDADDNLYVASVFGQTISKLDPETGEILEQLGNAEQVFFADDVTVGTDGTIYWTEAGAGYVFKHKDGETSAVAEGFPNANPLTLSDDGRLFFGQCYNSSPDTNGVFEAYPDGSQVPREIRNSDADIGCASNGMDWWDGALYSPQPFKGSVVRIDINTGEHTDVTTDWGVPIAVKFNSQGELHAANQANGEVVRIDLTTGDRTVLAQLPAGWLDNLAFDSNDRLYVSSYSDGTVVEIKSDGTQREVISGSMAGTMGLTIIGNTIYTSDPASLRGFDTQTGEAVSVIRSVFGVGPLPSTTNVVAWDTNLVLLSVITGELVIWDPSTETATLHTHFELPSDAEPFQGNLIVTEVDTGQVVRASGDELETRETIATTSNPVGLAATDDDLYVSDGVEGVVKLIIEDGVILDSPKTVVDGLSGPEGIALYDSGNSLLVVEGAEGQGGLIKVDLQSGDKETLLSDLSFQIPPPGFTPTHWFNDVEVDANGAIYINADRDNVIMKSNGGE